MHDMMEAVHEFHKKIGRPDRTPLAGDEYYPVLHLIGDQLLAMSRHLEVSYVRSPSVAGHREHLRAHLMTEELGEGLVQLANGDEEGVLDALTDLLYVLIGTAVELDLPLVEAFWEVQRSNMTKEKQKADLSSARVRDKGPNYSPPDLGRILREHREKQTCIKQ